MNMHSISGGKGELGDMVYEDKEYGQCPWARAREVGIALIKQRAKKEDTHDARGEHCTTMITSDLDIRIKADVFLPPLYFHSNRSWGERCSDGGSYFMLWFSSAR